MNFTFIKKTCVVKYKKATRFQGFEYELYIKYNSYFHDVNTYLFENITFHSSDYMKWLKTIHDQNSNDKFIYSIYIHNYNKFICL